MLPLIVGVFLLASQNNSSTTTDVSVYEATSTPILEFASTTFAGTPLMSIAFCESSLRQFNDDGTVLHGRIDTRDTGFMQINKYYHQAEADKLGLDLDTYQGNILFARWLYDRQGTRPWYPSKSCWSKST